MIYLDIAPLWAFALAMCPEAYRDLYSSKSAVFLSCAQRNPTCNSRLFQRYTIDGEIYAKKLLGIMLYTDEKKDKIVFKKLEAIGCKHFAKYYKYATKQKKYFSLAKFMNDCSLHNKTHAEIFSALGAILFFAQAQNKIASIHDVESRTLYNFITERLEQLKKPITSTIEKKNQEMLDNIYTNLLDRFGNVTSLGDYMSSHHYLQNKLYAFLEQISELDIFPLEALQSIKFTQADCLEIINIYIIKCRDSEFTQFTKGEIDELFMYFILAFIIRAYARNYTQAKETIREARQEESALEEHRQLKQQLAAARAKETTTKEMFALLQRNLTEGAK